MWWFAHVLYCLVRIGHTYLLKQSPFLFLKIFFMSICVGLYVCLCTTCMHCLQWSEQGIWCLGLELHMILSQHVGAGNQISGLWKRNYYFNGTTISSAPNHHLYMLKTLKVFSCLSVLQTVPYVSSIHSYPLWDRMWAFLSDCNVVPVRHSFPISLLSPFSQFLIIIIMCSASMRSMFFRCQVWVKTYRTCRAVPGLFLLTQWLPSLCNSWKIFSFYWWLIFHSGSSII